MTRGRSTGGSGWRTRTVTVARDLSRDLSREDRARAIPGIAIAAAVSFCACGGKREIEADRTAPVELAGSNASGSNASGSRSNASGSNGSGSNGSGSNADPWAGLAELPRVTAERIITIPTRPTLPRFTVGGPVIYDDIAVVSSSQFGFAAIDWRRGALAWTKPAGLKVSPPMIHGDRFVLVGDCVSPPAVPDNERLLGCLRVVTADGTDQAYIAIRGKAELVEAFAGSTGEQQLWIELDGTPTLKGAPGSRSISATAADGEFARWRRGDQIVRVNLLSGTATPVRVDEGAETLTPVRNRPPVTVAFGKRRWEIEQIDGRVVGFESSKRAWAARTEVNELLGAVWLPGQGPMVRMVKIGNLSGASEVRILDMDATGSMNGTASWTPVPGISILGRAISPVGDAALAIRMDSSIKRDFIAAYAASALLIYVFPLPEVLRADPVGVAIALDEQGHSEAVVAFYDGDQLAVLPNVSAPPTAPGATVGPLENATP
ncbi:MAG: hypothetical protein ACKV2T_35135 [Kofleriaceae bacterium]